MNDLQFLQQGAAHLQAGRVEEAERLFREILRANPAHGHAIGMMGLLRFQQNRAAAALALDPGFAGAPESFAVAGLMETP